MITEEWSRPERLAEVGEKLRRGELDYLEWMPLWLKRSTDLKERFDLVELHYVAALLNTGPRPIPYDNVLAQLRLSAQDGGFGFTRARRVKELFYLHPDVVKLLTQQPELKQLDDNALIDDDRLRLTPLEIELSHCIAQMWAKRSVLAQWLKKRRWPAPPELKQISTSRRGRPEAAFWREVDKRIYSWLEDNGCPSPGDGQYAELMNNARDWADARTENPPAKSTIQKHVRRAIERYSAKVGADK
jgi:hypothetical protein